MAGHGLAAPVMVQYATADYLEEMDPINELCIQGEADQSLPECFHGEVWGNGVRFRESSNFGFLR